MNDQSAEDRAIEIALVEYRAAASREREVRQAQSEIETWESRRDEAAGARDVHLSVIRRLGLTLPGLVERFPTGATTVDEDEIAEELAARYPGEMAVVL